MRLVRSPRVRGRQEMGQSSRQPPGPDMGVWILTEAHGTPEASGSGVAVREGGEGGGGTAVFSFRNIDVKVRRNRASQTQQGPCPLDPRTRGQFQRRTSRCRSPRSVCGRNHTVNYGSGCRNPARTSAAAWGPSSPHPGGEHARLLVRSAHGCLPRTGPRLWGSSVLEKRCPSVRAASTGIPGACIHFLI